MSFDLGRPLRDLAGIGPARERRLNEAGVADIGALLLHVPSRYEDRRLLSTIDQVEAEGERTLQGRLSGVRLVMRRGRRFSLVRGTLRDDTGELPVTWFNRPYLPRQVDEETEYVLHGKIKARDEGYELQNASCEPVGGELQARRIVPIYAALGPMGPALLRRVLTRFATAHSLVDEIEDPLPPEVLAEHGLPSLGEALAILHSPPDDADLAGLNSISSGAHQRLIYGELFAFQFRLAAARRAAAGVSKPHRVRWSPPVERIVRAVLPFELTAAQERVGREILADLQSEQPMRRLLQGDVGSGKTAVAAAAFVAAVESGVQCALMAPTELLAEQHYATLEALLGSRYRVALLTGATTTSAELQQGLADGTVDIAVGTHALIQERVEFGRLGLAVVDEQHRFGVAQRSRLGEKGSGCDLLVMTATPIPRSLTLTAYGDLDLSIIDELPPGRTPIETTVVGQRRRAEVWELLRREIDSGGRAYIVFARIHDSTKKDSDGAADLSLLSGERELAQSLPEMALGVVHGQVPIEERLAIMAEFGAGVRQVLLATTVIEVGVDVPEATLMIIEGAERFGLAQLHQLRGRVGRGRSASRCVAVHGRLTPEAKRRLAVFEATTDGFEIAEEDLAIRGPGELLGRRQAGVPGFHLADLRRDVGLLLAARHDARRILQRGDGEVATVASRREDVERLARV